MMKKFCIMRNEIGLVKHPSKLNFLQIKYLYMGKFPKKIHNSTAHFKKKTKKFEKLQKNSYDIGFFWSTYKTFAPFRIGTQRSDDFLKRQCCPN